MIESLMGDQHSAYWKGPHADALQSEYRRILEAGEGDTTQPGESQSVSVAANDVPAYVETLANLGEAGKLVAKELQSGGKPAVEAMVQTATELENAIGSEATNAFYGLHDDLQAVVYGELARSYVPRVPNISAARVEEFKAEDTGRLLADRWGNDMPRRLAIAKYRIHRMLEPLGERGKELWWDFWLDRLRASERAAILDRLTS